MAVSSISKNNLQNWVAAVYENARQHVKVEKIDGVNANVFDEARNSYPKTCSFVTHGPLLDFSDRSFHLFDWSSTHTTNIQTAPANAASSQPLSEEEQAKQKKEQEYTRAKWIGSLASVVATFATAYFWSSFWDARAVLNDTNNMNEMVNTHLNKHPLTKEEQNSDQNIYKPLQDLISIKTAIDVTNYSRARDFLLSSTILLGGSFATAAGGFLKYSVLMNGGYLFIALGVISSLWFLGTHWEDNDKNSLGYQQIVGYKPSSGDAVPGLAVKIRELFCRYNESMQAPPDYKDPNPSPPPQVYQYVNGFNPKTTQYLSHRRQS